MMIYADRVLNDAQGFRDAADVLAALVNTAAREDDSAL